MQGVGGSHGCHWERVLVAGGKSPLIRMMHRSLVPLGSPRLPGAYHTNLACIVKSSCGMRF